MKALDLVRIYKIQHELWVIKYVKDLPRFFFICLLFSHYFSNRNKLYITTLLLMPLTIWNEKIVNLSIYFPYAIFFRLTI